MKKKWIKKLITRHQVIIRNKESLAEKTTFNFSYAKLILLGFFSLLLVAFLSLKLSHVILGRWLNPAYVEQRNTHKLTELYTSLEKLKEKTERQEQFIKALQIALGDVDGQAGAAEHSKKKVESRITQNDTTKTKPSQEVVAEVEDQQISSPAQGKSQSAYLQSTTYQNTVRDTNNMLWTPLNGVITTSFTPSIEHYGLDIVGREDEPIKCIDDGIVILATWTVEAGWIIMVQHSYNLVSVYKHNATLLKKTGDVVKGGDAIAIMGNSGEFSTGPHLHFELWCDGNAVNPENFISF